MRLFPAFCRFSQLFFDSPPTVCSSTGLVGSAMLIASFYVFKVCSIAGPVSRVLALEVLLAGTCVWVSLV